MLASTLWLAACTTQSATDPVTTVAIPVTQTLPELLAAAERATAAGNYPDAARWYVQMARLSGDEQQLEEAARACYDTQQLRAALQIAKRWLDINPTNQQARELAALTALKLYEVDEAAAQLQVLFESAYITPAAGFIEWSNKIAGNDDHAALAVMEKLAAAYPQLAEANYVVARLAEHTENLGLMQESAQRAHELAPYWSPAGLQLARAQLLRGEQQLALQTAQEVIKNDGSLATRSDYAAFLLAAGKPNEAVRLWRELEQTEGDNSAAVRALAQIDFQVGNFQSAFNRFNTLLNSGKYLSESIFYLAGIAERTGGTAEARQLYGRVQDGEFASAAQLRIAKLIQDSDGLAEALSFLESYGEASPDELLLSLQARTQMLSAAGDDAAALKIYNQALRDYPDVASLRLARAFLLVKMDKPVAALQAMYALHELRPQDPTVLNALGYTLLDHSKQYQQGHDYIELALQHSPDSAAVMDSMGWALFKLDQKEEALVYLQKAAQKMNDSEVDLHLGEVLWALNRRDEAVQVWQQGLKRSPDNKALQQRTKRAAKYN
ncbi:MAG: hypothetical protein AB7Q04_09610 [Steroidobacteraceae bacterium]